MMSRKYFEWAVAPDQRIGWGLRGVREVLERRHSQILADCLRTILVFFYLLFTSARRQRRHNSSHKRHLENLLKELDSQ